MLPSGIHKDEMSRLLLEVCDSIRGRPLDEHLELHLNREFGVGTQSYARMVSLLKIGVEEEWAAYVEIDGADYRRGRIAEASLETAGMSIESGLLRDVKGQYYCHTNGEINMIIPLEEGAQFCGHGAGWCVFAPLSEHFPTVTRKALILYFLPGGAIEYRTPPADQG